MSIPTGPSEQPPGAYPSPGAYPPAGEQPGYPAGYPGAGPSFPPPAPVKKSRRGLWIALIVVVVLLVGGGTAVAFLVKDKVNNITTIVDPGCTQGKDVILSNADLGGGSDPAVAKAKLQTMISGLDKAASAAQHDDVRAAMTALSGDYKALLKGMDTGQLPSDLMTRVTTDAKKIDDLCTLGGAQK